MAELQGVGRPIGKVAGLMRKADSTMHWKASEGWRLNGSPPIHWQGITGSNPAKTNEFNMLDTTLGVVVVLHLATSTRSTNAGSHVVVHTVCSFDVAVQNSGVI